ncbi:hypothetical protein ACJX0J_021249, partial [Zea mays]
RGNKITLSFILRVGSEFIKDDELIPSPPQEKRKMNTNVSFSEDVGKNVGAAARAMAKD